MRFNQLPAFFIAIFLGAACMSGSHPGTFRLEAGGEANIGRIKEADGEVTVTIISRNDYPDTLFPLRYYTKCGCTVVNISHVPVPPGQDEKIEVVFNPAYRPGPFSHDLRVIYRNSPVRQRQYTISGEVLGYRHPIEEDRPYNMGEGLYLSQKSVYFGHLSPGETRDIFIRHGNGSRRKSKVEFEIPDEWKPYISMRQPGIMKADERDTLHIRLTMPQRTDSLRFNIQPYVNGVPTPEIVQVSARKR